LTSPRSQTAITKLLSRREGRAEGKITCELRSRTRWRCAKRRGAAGKRGRMAAALAPGVSRKLKKVLETRTDSPDLLASLGALSTFYEHNTPQARRNLKSSVEQRALAINRHFLDASLPAQKALVRVEGEVHALDDSWKKIEEALSSCSASTGDIISTTERLQ
uniref:Conserved oligomeric Golgi complex subunit 6 n=3 Tax=Aegilops tauschii subsp. strangulata TaxID=200361 RepID=A0A453IKH2_AEGTS